MGCACDPHIILPESPAALFKSTSRLIRRQTVFGFLARDFDLYQPVDYATFQLQSPMQRCGQFHSIHW